ncbi:ABC transporter ATP-binding protein [Stutzerimonas zhaodongensis]|uniref:ABC transporter ATP-binding protein n=1 Tax=Stutzerimonas zhaodongensis TaxID=1176257 RepID=UPI00210422D0|nr:ABC transporter ATP-binding protein [Stutzerimonas zhaodongensis]MCQ2031176.1 ABC transporter ATP-binding protein [Stutzerimonas zhaodongensis]
MGTITVSNLGKAYKQYPTRWSRLAEWLMPGHKVRHSLKWVLQDISFTVAPGEAVGIIGINGAGKSTLLKMITGTTQPTTGSVNISGRVAALLELGMGFHPDFTGRQNAFMAGQLLGYSVEEIASLMPEIEAFAEIGDYIDQPVRVYSSGMQMRLAFSVATARRPDVLIVDEALSVGDAYFQHKSFDRIREFRKQGTTLLLVSHDKAAIQSICDRAILLNSGRLAMEGNPEAVMDYYNAMLANHQNQSVKQEVCPDGKVQTVSGTGEARVTAISLTNDVGQPIEAIDVGQAVSFRIEIEALTAIDRLVLGYGIKDRLGQVIYGTNTDLKNQPLLNVAAGSQYIFKIDFPANLGPGTYSVQTALVSTDTHLVNNYEWRDLALVFNVININKPHFAGCAWIDPQIEILQV